MPTHRAVVKTNGVLQTNFLVPLSWCNLHRFPLAVPQGLCQAVLCLSHPPSLSDAADGLLSHLHLGLRCSPCLPVRACSPVEGGRQEPSGRREAVLPAGAGHQAPRDKRQGRQGPLEAAPVLGVWGSGAGAWGAGPLLLSWVLPSWALAVRKGEARAGMRKLVSASSPPGSAGLWLLLSRPGVRAPLSLNNFWDTHWGVGARDVCF